MHNSSPKTGIRHCHENSSVWIVMQLDHLFIRKTQVPSSVSDQ